MSAWWFVALGWLAGNVLLIVVLAVRAWSRDRRFDAQERERLGL